MKPVNSSNISAIGYNPDTKVLSIQFKAGELYNYEGVTQAAYDTFEKSESIGKHFSKYIRNVYKATKEEKPKPKTLLIDDQRNLEATVVARSYFQGIEALATQGPFDVLYLDHDLASYDEEGREKTGYDVICFLEQNQQFKPKKVEIVSSNPVGRQRIQQVIDKLYGETK